MLAFKVEAKTASNIFNSPNAGPIDLKNEFTLRMEPGEVECSRGTRDKSIKATNDQREVGRSR